MGSGPSSKNRVVLVEGVVGGTAAPVSSITSLDNVENVSRGTGVDWFAADVNVPNDGVVMIGFEMDTSAVVTVDIVRDASTISADLNAGSSVNEGWQFFELPVKEDDDINIAADNNVTVSCILNLRRT